VPFEKTFWNGKVEVNSINLLVCGLQINNRFFDVIVAKLKPDPKER
jgi:hypothetical protein